MTLRVLVVARWYPSHDSPGRGSFVADLVEALVNEDVDVAVASWEYALYSRFAATGDQLARGTSLWTRAVSRPEALNTPRAWGARVPVARLPAFHMTGESIAQQVDAHAALLVPFGVWRHAHWPIDIIHAHTGLPDGLAALRLASELDRPLIVTEHDRSLRTRLADSSEAQASYRELIYSADRVVAVSAQFRSLLTARLGLPESAMQVLSNAIPDTFYAQPIDGPRDADELLYVGHRLESKGTPTLLEAFAIARAAHARLHLRMVGRSMTMEDELRWRSMAQALGIADSVVFDEPTDRLGVARAMARATALVHPSPFESFGMIVAEALACGLPVVATPSGVEELIGQSGQLGEVSTAEDAPSLAAAILRLVGRRGEFFPERLREAARPYQASTVARATIGSYRRLLAARGLSPGTTPEADSVGASPERKDLRSPIVIGFNRHLAEQRLRGLPPPLLARLTFVTKGRDAVPDGKAPTGNVIETDLEAAYRSRLAALGSPPGARWTLAQRVLNFVRSPRKALARRHLRMSRDQQLMAAAKIAVRDAWRDSRDTEATPRSLLPLDLNDVLAAEAAVAAGAEITPGSTRWLADRWDEIGAPSGGSEPVPEAARNAPSRPGTV